MDRLTIKAYNQQATAYAERWNTIDLADDRTRFAVHVQPNARVLDLGCGPGRDIAHLSQAGFRVIGVDASLNMLLEARRRGITAPLIQADIQALPFAKSSFRAIWASASLLHIPREKVPATLQEWKRVIYPGTLYLSVKEGEGEERTEDGRLFVYYHPAEIQLLVERAGFHVLHCQRSEDKASRQRAWITLIACTKLVTPRVATAVVVFNQQGHILLIRRSDNGRWCLPGGHVDPGETVVQTAIRETWEETGLRVEVERLVGVYSGHYPPDYPGEAAGKPLIILVFQCRPVGGTLICSEESPEVGFFPLDALPEPLVESHRQRILDAIHHPNEVILR